MSTGVCVLDAIPNIISIHPSLRPQCIYLLLKCEPHINLRILVNAMIDFLGKNIARHIEAYD